MRARLAAMVVAVVVMAGALGGCQPDPQSGPAGSSAPSSAGDTSASPTEATTPAPTETPTSSEEALFAEAKQVFLEYNEAETAVYAAGGAKTMPPSVAPYVMGDYAVALASLFAEAKADGLEVRGANTIVVRSVNRAPNQSGSLVAVQPCIDSSGMSSRTSGGDWEKGLVYGGTWLMKRDSDGRLKIFEFVDSEVAGCS